MLIALIVFLVVLIDNCDPGPIVEPLPCRTVLCGSDCSDPFPFSTCDFCPGGTVDVAFCSPVVDAGTDGDVVFPPDASCEETPCFRPAECVLACEDEEPIYVGCCACPGASFDRVDFCGVAEPDAGVDAGGLLGIGDACFDDRQCASGLCYGAADASGAFGEATCQAACLPVETRESYCLNDRHCCEGRCCIGCGEREGLCVTETPAPPPSM